MQLTQPESILCPSPQLLDVRTRSKQGLGDTGGQRISTPSSQASTPRRSSPTLPCRILPHPFTVPRPYYSDTPPSLYFLLLLPATLPSPPYSPSTSHSCQLSPQSAPSLPHPKKYTPKIWNGQARLLFANGIFQIRPTLAYSKKPKRLHYTPKFQTTQLWCIVQKSKREHHFSIHQRCIIFLARSEVPLTPLFLRPDRSP